jgi:hypothetical protein
MDLEELKQLERALQQLAAECNTREKAIALFQSDGYFDENGKLAREYRSSE